MAAPTKQVPDFPPPKKSDHTVPGTSFAGPYKSKFTKKAEEPLLELLAHVNCSYLSSSRKKAPTLLDLKQHAHSLAVLIRYLTLSTKSGVVNNGNFEGNESFDWLNDLDHLYENEEGDHNRSLITLLNLVKDGLRPADEADEINLQNEPEQICPTHQTHRLDIAGQKLLPFATHAELAKHANECLERLDHEFSGHGGLLGIMPLLNDESDEGTIVMGENTILGQMIAFMRALVLRIHNFEIDYANALDVLAGEAVVPREILTEIGPDGRAGREVSYAQDQFVLCGVQKEKGAYAWLKSMFEEKELQNENMGMGTENGMTWVEIPTKYYRLKGDGTEKTVFVVPQWEGTEVTRSIETRPTVVQVVKPVWPERCSTWETRYKAGLSAAKALEPELAHLRHRVSTLEADVEVLAQQNKHLEIENALWNRTEGAEEFFRKGMVEGKLSEVEQVERERRELAALRRNLEARDEALRAEEAEAREWISIEKRKWLGAWGVMEELKVVS
jgi:hypothetical protein